MNNESCNNIEQVRARNTFIRIKNTPESLQLSKVEFQILAEAAPFLLFILQDNKLCYINSEFVNITGYSEEECLNMNLWDFIHPDFHMMIKERGIAHQQDNTIPTKYETKLLCRDGKVIWVDLYIDIIEYHGKPAVSGMIFNINEHKKFEEAFHKSEKMYQTIFESTGTAMMLFNEDMLISLVNSEFEKLSGYDKVEIQNNKRWPEFVAQEDQKRLKEYHRLRRLEHGYAPQSYEFKLLDKGGNLKDVCITVNMIPGTTESVCSFIDITEQKETESEVKYLSFYDKVTGLYNRTFFERELNRLDSSDQLPISLIIGDVNGLKLVNDVFGHKEGDKLLAKAAEILKQSCREGDIVARWGEDEFIILLPRTNSKTAFLIYERINKYTKEIIKPISISLGQATKTTIEQDIQKTLTQAEDKMYRNKLLENKSTRSSLVTSLERILWEKSHETNEHCQRLMKMAEQIGKKINLPIGDLDDLKLLAALHDLGKVAIPDHILNKSDQLIPEEWEIIKKHPETGYHIALSLPEIAHIAEAILAHHEHWNGSGYPLGLKGKDIPLISRILTIVDAYDVMIQGRVYKEALDRNEALAEIRRCANIQFDPELVKVFEDFIREQCD